ncbi:hypothetical protein GCM10010532_100060 [Dactylosporangium siamense]|uniref:Uncharacterized protein n=2 Tax=Dactylosporangium siamense TaxID=685454 RepID=A0A919PXP1_9ACTN|nr:hypothetical protein Dsi01nite_091970 [Dactylosporangium siamense]
MLQDAERNQAVQDTRDRKRELRERERQAAETMLSYIREHNVTLTDATDDEAKQFASGLAKVISFESIYVSDPTVRRYLFLSSEIMDMVSAGELHAKSAVFAVRFNCYIWLGVWIREERDVPPPTETWARMAAQLADAGARFRSRMQSEGCEIEDPLQYL